MNSPFRPYIEHCFRTHFTDFKLEWVDLALRMIDEERALISSDFAVKVPKAQLGESFDIKMAELIEVDSALFAPLLYRIEHAIFRRDPTHPVLPFLAQIMKLRTGMEIYYSAQIGPRFMVMHGVGAVLGPRHRIGSDFTLYQCATLGQRRNHCPDEFLTIGDRCTFFTGAVALGLLRIGDDVKLAANAVLLTDAEARATYAGVPAVKVSR